MMARTKFSGSILAAWDLPIRPASRLVASECLGDHRELARRFGIIDAALDRIGAQHEHCVHGVGFKGCRYRGPRPVVVMEHVPHGLELADGHDALLVDG